MSSMPLGEQPPKRSRASEIEQFMRTRMLRDCENVIQELAGSEGVEFIRQLWTEKLADTVVLDDRESWDNALNEIDMFFPGAEKRIRMAWGYSLIAEMDSHILRQIEAEEIKREQRASTPRSIARKALRLFRKD